MGSAVDRDLASRLPLDQRAAGNWFATLTPVERRTFWACFLAWTSDAMAVQLYVVAMPVIIGLWHLGTRQAGTLGTSAVLVSSLGGWLAGMLSDRFGRVRTLRLTILWFLVFTVLSGFTHSYGQLLLARSLQGLGFGGEWAAGGVLISEVISREKRGRAVGTVAGGWSVGYGSAVILHFLVFSFAPPALAWRLLFVLGIVPALGVLWFCRNLEEPEIYRKMKSDPEARRIKGSLLDIFSPRLLGTTAIAALLATGGLGGNYTMVIWLPTYLNRVRNLSVLNTDAYLAVNIFGSFLGYVMCAHLCDWIGRRRTFVLTACAASITVAVYTMLPLSRPAVLLLGFPLGFFQSGIVAGMGATFAELFPTRVRGTGQGFCYNTGRGLGAFVAYSVGLLAAAHIGLGQAIGICAVCSYALVLCATALLPETRGRELEANA